MEAKFSKLSVGIFLSTIICSTVAACLWFFYNSLFVSYNNYRIIFPSSIAGLYVGSQVSYNGVQVGQVSEIAIYERFNNQVVATLSVDAKIKIKQDTFATLNMKGITGQMFIELNGGSTNSPTLKQSSDQTDLIIKYQESTLGILTNAAPMVLAQISSILKKLELLLQEKNTQAIEKILTQTSLLITDTRKLPILIEHTLTDVHAIFKLLSPILKQIDQKLTDLPNNMQNIMKQVKPIMGDLVNIADNAAQITQKVNHHGLWSILATQQTL